MANQKRNDTSRRASSRPRRDFLTTLCRPLSWCFPCLDLPSSSPVRTEPSSTTSRPRIPRVHGYGEFDTTPKKPTRKYGYGEFDKPLPNRPFPETELQASSSRRSQPQSTDRVAAPPIMAPIAKRAHRALPAPAPPPSPPARVQSPINRLQSPITRTQSPRTPPPILSTALSDPHLAEVLSILTSTLHHIPFAVCGLTALILHGNNSRRAKHISIVCSEDTKDTLRSWAAADPNYELDPAERSHIGVRLSDGTLRRVRVKFLVPEAFGALTIVKMLVGGNGGGGVPTLGLQSLLDQIALGYSSDRKAMETNRAREMIARDALWVLRQIAEEKRRRPRSEGLHAGNCPQVLNPLFWEVFTVIHPESVALFRQAGLGLPGMNPYGGFADQGRRGSHSQGVSVRDSGRSLTSEWSGVSIEEEGERHSVGSRGRSQRDSRRSDRSSAALLP